MDSSRLISLVQEYEELYNLKNFQYSNQQRRDNVWDEIGRRMKQPSAACRSQWTRIRDNHRKALNLRRTRSGQGLSKMKPPKYHMELQFLSPFLTDEEEVESEFQNAATTNTFQAPSVDSTPALSTFPQSASSSTRNLGKRVTENSTPQQSPTILENYLKSKVMQAESLNQPSDPLFDFFINMAQTVKSFPLQDQIKIKGQLFQMVHTVEMRLVNDTQLPNPDTQLTIERKPNEIYLKSDFPESSHLSN